jgi:hypothetical protein
MIAPFFDKLAKELIDIAMRENAFNKDYNLSLYCILAIDALISYSSHDKIEKLNEIIAYFIGLFESSINSHPNEVVLQFQSYYCIIFRSVFRKTLKMIDLNIAEKIYTVLEASFKQRQCVYEEALLAIAALASSMYL